MKRSSSIHRPIRRVVLAVVSVLSVARGGRLAADDLPPDVSRVVTPDIVESLIAQAAASTIHSVDLHPENDSEVPLAALKLDLLDDGRRVVRGLLIVTDAEAAGAFDFVVDPSSGTYRTEASEPARPAFEALPGDFRSAEVRMQLTKADGASNGPKSAPPCQPCNGNWTARVSTLDPIFIELTETTVRGIWGEVDYRGKCRWREVGLGSCWAANPSSLGTHWFVDACEILGPGTNVTNSARYHNFDFGFNDLITAVAQTATVHFVPGTGVVVSWSHEDSGEASALIRGSLSHSGSNNCP